MIGVRLWVLLPRNGGPRPSVQSLPAGKRTSVPGFVMLLPPGNIASPQKHILAWHLVDVDKHKLPKMGTPNCQRVRRASKPHNISAVTCALQWQRASLCQTHHDPEPPRTPAVLARIFPIPLLVPPPSRGDRLWSTTGTVARAPSSLRPPPPGGRSARGPALPAPIGWTAAPAGPARRRPRAAARGTTNSPRPGPPPPLPRRRSLRPSRVACVVNAFSTAAPGTPPPRHNTPCTPPYVSVAVLVVCYLKSQF